MARHILLPFQIDPTGGIAYTEDPARIVQQDLISAVGTHIGERVMTSRYGTRLIDHVFDPNDDELVEALEQSVRESITLNMPNIAVQEIEISQDLAEGSVGLHIRYSLNNNTSEGSVTVPLPLREDF